jgi:hypothetical protein
VFAFVRYIPISFFLFFSFCCLFIVIYLSASGGSFLRGPFLLHGLVFRKSKSHPLRHFDVPTGAMFQAGSLVLVERLGPKGTDAAIGTPLYQIVVHAQTIRQLHLFEVLHELLLFVGW